MEASRAGRCVSVVRPLPRAPPPPPRRLEREPAPRPRFVTTVTTGRFLPPPPQLAALLGLRDLYEEAPHRFAYSSAPKPVENRREHLVAVGYSNTHKSMRGCDLLAATRSIASSVAGLAHVIPRHDTDSVAPYANVMHEKRVIRGSTFTAHPLAAGDAAAGESAAGRAAATRRRTLARRAAAARRRRLSPPPAPGRLHHPVQTDYYLEELCDKGVEMEVGVQTDLFVDRPSTPLYVPAKTGADAETQIYPGELFDFDLEVQPILEVLVGKTSEQALSEVAQEEELATLREQQRRFRELRDAERAERLRLAEQERRLQQEKVRRVGEARVAAAAAAAARERVAAAALVRGYVAELLPAVLAGLRSAGFLADARAAAVSDEFLPWLADEVSIELEALLTSRDLITEIVREVTEARAELYRGSGEEAALRLEVPPPPESLTPPSELGEFHEEEEDVNEEE